MAAPAKPLLTELPKGHQFPATTFEFTAADVAAYLDAVDDRNDVYAERALAPPLAAAARALGALLDVIELPAGTLHAGQEVEMHAPVPIGSRLTLAGRIAQRSERGGAVLAIIEFDVTPDGSTSAALRGRTTVIAPAPGGAPS